MSAMAAWLLSVDRNCDLKVANLQKLLTNNKTFWLKWFPYMSKPSEPMSDEDFLDSEDIEEDPADLYSNSVMQLRKLCFGAPKLRGLLRTLASWGYTARGSASSPG